MLRFACLCSALTAALMLASGTADAAGKKDKPSATWRVSVKPTARAGLHAMRGIASYYWQGQRTANGERFNKTGMTAAHRTLPFNTRVRVTNVHNQRSVVVRINDRGPFTRGRVIDVSDGAAAALGMRGRGLASVVLEVVD